jgi:sulfite exporter TauE/SafE
MGVLMVVLVLIPYRKLNVGFATRLVGQLKQSLGLNLKKNSPLALFTIGILNGFLPCGLVYMAVVGALSLGDHVEGTLYMVLFGLGTIPMMTLAVFAGNFVSVKLRSGFQKIIPVLVVIVGILFILRGLGLGIPYISPSDAKLQVASNPATCITVE